MFLSLGSSLEECVTSNVFPREKEQNPRGNSHGKVESLSWRPRLQGQFMRNVRMCARTGCNGGCLHRLSKTNPQSQTNQGRPLAQLPLQTSLRTPLARYLPRLDWRHTQSCSRHVHTTLSPAPHAHINRQLNGHSDPRGSPKQNYFTVKLKRRPQILRRRYSP